MNVYRDPDVPISETVDQVFAISLSAVPSGGYTWMEEYDPELLELLRPKYYVPPLPRLGSGGREVAVGESREERFEFRARQPGETQIRMRHQREWEPNPRDAKTFRVHITVKELKGRN